MNIVIRADASVAIGTGHVMRCLSLADVLCSQGAVVQFICRLHDGHLCELIRDRGFEVHALSKSSDDLKSQTEADFSTWLGATWRGDASETISVIDGLGFRPDWLIIDHYALSANWERSLRDSVDKIMVIDDLADRAHDCDLLLDQNLYENAETRYVGIVPEQCQLLIGPRFALLRDEFRAARTGISARTGSVERILIFFGGVDRANLTDVVIRAMDRIIPDDLQVDVIIGEQNCHRKEIESKCAARDFTCYVQTDRTAELMSGADISIGAGGSTTWERCCLGLPCLAFAVADNQSLLVRHATLSGILYSPDVDTEDADAVAMQLQAFIDNPLLRESMSRKSMSVVDGYGADRVRRALGPLSVSIRAATTSDSEAIFEWRNGTAVREMSLDSAPIDWTAHCAWIESVLADANRLLLIGESEMQSVGVVRFDISGDTANLSIYLVPEQMNRGFGTELLVAAEQWLMSARPELRLLRAEVVAGNNKSHKLFQKAGYCAGTTEYSKRLK